MSEASPEDSRDVSPAGVRDGCGWCGGPLRAGARRDALFCGKRCRQASWRFGCRRARAHATGRPMRFAYADPPYPGKAARYYPDGQEIDHANLIARLIAGWSDGWALSTSSEALRDVLPLCPPDVRVCAWVRAPRHVPGSRWPARAWEPLVVAGGRPRHVAQDLERRVTDVLDYRGRYRAFPGAIIGMKPPQFAVWLFEQFGATPGDQLDDLFPGSGAVTEAWRRYVSPEASRDGSCAHQARAGG